MRKEIDFNTYEKRRRVKMMPLEPDVDMQLQSGVAGAIKACIDEYYPGTEVKIDHVERSCRL